MQSTSIKLALAQINPMVGDIDANTATVISTAREAEQSQAADLIIFPELVLTGYPPEDLLMRPSLEWRINRALDALCQANLSVALLIGYPRVVAGRVFNMAGLIRDGSLVAEYAKQCLPNYQVFDEKRYFLPGNQACIVDIAGVKTALTVCEDIWQPEPMLQAKAAGAQLMLNINASPYHRGKTQERRQLLTERALQGSMPIVYVNQVGGQDELVFDGHSMAVNADGSLAMQAPAFEEGVYFTTLTLGSTPQFVKGENAPDLPSLASIYRALVLGVRDYVNKNGFKGVVLGLSGGIDSALTLAIAVDALGPERVDAVMMPFTYTSDMSQTDAADQASRMGVRYRSIGIEPIYKAFTDGLAAEFQGLPLDTTEENLQARCRGVLLMALSNKKGLLVLTTGNKSELAVGYSTLYGDMAGGFDVLKDVPKTVVFELARFRNTESEVIPVSVIDRPPSAELRPDQKDEDSLPPYDVLDAILERYVEQDCSAEQIVAEGFDAEQVRQVLRLVDLNEYKRRQAPIGPRLTKRGFGRDRRYPITNGWRIGD
ncbi:NAD+ synthase [Simiduia aestuariiviva]|uniref:Glutamine-dependent NAD(+) synthetase n=1 Tax=Simiduia aestuariiviva TaxID=1510459 RepID=A0A839UUK8_9GAMM|nr:NAD+ synthase [Simiduia aestuariiviva]MBB3170130.1 NAD+ synthase (glutamine-hydrolyzing) [Simiduia aestuariiviva]